MPASYAHYRFGKLLLANLPGDVRQTIQRFRRMYDMGLQGPDFFFFSNIFVRTATVQMGSTFHHQTGQEFFPVACKAATSDAAKAYLYGLLGHYCLDSICHPFVNRLAAIGEARHVPLESEFERFLLTLDKEPSPHTFDMSKFIRLTRGEAATVSDFYPGSTGGQVAFCVRSMGFIARFMTRPQRQRQIPFLEKRVGFIYDHMIPTTENPDFAPYIRELYDLYNQALDQYPRMLSQLAAHLQDGTALGEDFSPDFG